MRIRNKALLTCAAAYAVCSAGVLWGQVKITVSPANQPVDGSSAATMKAFSALNASLADVVDPSASACVKSYAVYQACKADDSAGACGVAPTCSVTTKMASMSLGGARFIFTPGVEAASLVPRDVTMYGNHEVKIIRQDALPPAAGVAPAGSGDAHTAGTEMATGKQPVMIVKQMDGGTGVSRSNGPVKVAGGVIAGARTSFVQPSYPAVAKAAKMSGVVVMTAVIKKDGSIGSLEISSHTNSIFDSAAMDAVRQWKYRPYMLNGEPTEVMTTITVNFAMSPPPPRIPNGSMSQPDEHIPSLPH